LTASAGRGAGEVRRRGEAQRIRTAGRMEKPLVIVLTGNGKGKSTSAFGQVLRASGHGMKALVVQFVKSPGEYGEIAALRRVPGAEVHTLGIGFVGGPHGGGASKEEHRKAALAALNLARERASSGGFHLVVLDEANFALSAGLLEKEEVLGFLDGLEGPIAVVLTGRGAPAWLADRADTVTEMLEVKHHYAAGIKAKKGIEF